MQKQNKRFPKRTGRTNFMTPKEYEATKRKIKKKLEANEKLNRLMAQFLYGSN